MATSAQLDDLIDRDQLVGLVNRYLTTLDDRVPLDTAWASSLFSDDVRIERRGTVLTGPEEVAAGHAFVMAGWERTHHFTSNHTVNVDGDRAHLNARMAAVHVHRDGGPIEPFVATNALDADAVRTPDGWRFQNLSLRLMWSSGQSHLDLAS